MSGFHSAALSGTAADPAALVAALERTQAIAEFAPDGTVLRANCNYLRLFGYSQLPVDGLHHRAFCPAEQLDVHLYQAFWNALRQGEAHSGRYLRLTATGQQVWVEASYSPIRDAQGAVLRIVKIARDVSAQIAREQFENKRYRVLAMCAEHTDSAMVITDGGGRVVYINSALTRMFGFRAEEVLDQPVDLMVNMPHAGHNILGDIRQKLFSGQPYRSEELIYNRFDQPLWCSLTVNPVLDADGGLRNSVCVIHEVTETKMREVLQYKALDAMARDTSLADTLQLICREVERIAPEVIASILRVDDEQRLRPIAAPSLPDSYARTLDGLAIGPQVGSCGTAAWRSAAVLVRDIATDPLWTHYKEPALALGLRACWSTPIHGYAGQVLGTFAFYFRETRGPNDFHKRLVALATHLCTLALEREQARNQIRQLAYYDALTGLPNRRMLLVQAEQTLAHAQRTNSAVTVMFIDLDRFKQINDSLGHPAGDALLRIVAERLRSQMRASDFVGRLSGDEFVVVLADCDEKRAADIVERIQALLVEQCEVAGAVLRITASIGISLCPGDGTDIDTLLHRADLAMYQAKSSGRGCFSFFSEEMNRLAQERLALEAALREALRERRLLLHYQPQIDLNTGQVCGIEALARWQHPQFGNVSPMRFIPLAEECGLIGELGNWAVNEACRQLGEWRRAGLTVPAISVNLSPTNFHNLNLPQQIASTLAQHELQPADLTLEITESVLLDTNPSTLKTLHEVHAQGVGLAMDDFGTGYSSLSYLRRLPVDALKLDRSFVHGMEHDETARALTEAVIRIGDSLHLTVVAEGIENETQRYLLHEQGYKVAQGYLFSRPLPPERLAEWLRNCTTVPTQG